MRNKIAAYAQKYQGDWSSIAKAISNQEPADVVNVNTRFLTIVDKEYPECLKRLRFPPWILYYEGNLDLLSQSALAIVGSRELCDYAKWVIERLVRKGDCQWLGKRCGCSCTQMCIKAGDNWSFGLWS